LSQFERPEVAVAAAVAVFLVEKVIKIYGLKSVSDCSGYRPSG